MNIFSVLGVRYEVFHSRMLHWLLSPQSDHGAGDRFWRPFQELLGIAPIGEVIIKDEVKIDSPQGDRWRLADLLIRTGDLLILVENKVDPAYQDLLQVQDEVGGGRVMADAEGRRFLFALVAPGPLTADMQSLIGGSNGVFIAWNDLVTKLEAVSRDGLDTHVAEIIRQYLEFARRPTIKGANTVDDRLVNEAADAVRTLIREVAVGQAVTAVDLWSRFLEQFPDHAAALNEFYADAKNYSAKAWFAFRLQKWAAKRDLLEDTGQWQSTSVSSWGYNKVRIYRRVAD